MSDDFQLAVRVASRFIAVDVLAHGTAKGWKTRKDRDEEVERDLPADYRVLWRKLKNQFKGTPNERREQFLEYVESHPEEPTQMLQEQAEKQLREWAREEARKDRAEAAAFKAEVQRREHELQEWAMMNRPAVVDSLDAVPF